MYFKCYLLFIGILTNSKALKHKTQFIKLKSEMFKTFKKKI